MTEVFPPRNIHNALQYNDEGKVEMRVNANLNITDATFNFSGTVSVDNFPESQTVDGTVDVGNWPSIQAVTVPDGPNLSAFSRQRITPARLLGEFRTFYGTTGGIEIINKTAGTASVLPDLTSKYTLMTVGNTNGDRAVRQSRQYHPYIPGTSQLGMITFCFQAAKSNLFQGAGMYDDDNGIFFSMNGLTPTFAIKKAGVDDSVTQDFWNVDKFDGTGPSGIDMNFATAQILVIDYQWLGVGRVRVGFDVDGQIFYAHYFDHANSVTEPYNHQPSLPVRWEIKNLADVADSSSIKAICFAVYCEGEDFESGFTNGVSNKQTGITINNGTAHGMLAVRLKNTVNSIPVKAFARLKNWSILSSNDIYYKIVMFPGISSLSGTPVWADVASTSWCEYTTDFSITSDLPANTVVLHEGYAAGSNGNTGNINANGTEARSAAIYQNMDSSDSMIIAVIGYKLANNATSYASLNWLEIK